MLAKVFCAYDESMSGLETVMRLHSVKRWHMIDTTRQQTLAEHSANVALLVFYIVKTSPTFFFDSPESAAVSALVHDLAEAFTGDIPSHTKKYLSGVDELESRLLNPVFDTETSVDTQTLIKMCDLADGIRFIRLHGVDLTAVHAREGLEAQLRKKFNECEWPERVHQHVWDLIRFYAHEKR